MSSSVVTPPAATAPCTSAPNNVSSTESPLSTMSGISHISAATATQATQAFDLVDDAYAQFDRTYGGYRNSVGKESELEDENVADEGDASSSDSSTFWDLLLSLYLPLALVWLRRGMLGTANLFRSLILGHCLRLIFSNLSEWMNENTPWLHPVLFQQATCNGKVDPQAWPPPALTALAILTVVALVVHPDGFTWIMLGKIRDAMLSIFDSSAACWSLIVKDYGVIPTVAASATLASLVLLILVMRRTLTPRQGPKRHMQPHDRKKKKRKGHTRHRGSGNSGTGARIKSSPSSSKVIQSPASPKTSLLHDQPFSQPSPPPKILEETALDMAIEKPKALNSLLLSDSGIDTSAKNSESAVPSTSKCLISERSRSRVPSVSTLDTTAMSDDQSCGSTSVRSAPSVGVSTALGSTVEQASVEKGKSSKKHTRNSNNSSNSGPINGSRRQHRRGGGGGKSSKFEKSTPGSYDNKAPADGPMVPSSRWDALKPSPNHQSSHNNHHQQSHHHRPAGRRSASNKKGRSSFAGGTSNPPRQHVSTDSFFSRAATTSPGIGANTKNQSESGSTSIESFLSDAGTTAPSLFPTDNASRLTAYPGPPPGLSPLPCYDTSSMNLSSQCDGSVLTGTSHRHETAFLTSAATNFDWQCGSNSGSVVSPVLDSPQLQQKELEKSKWIESDELQRAIVAGVVQPQIPLHHHVLGQCSGFPAPQFSHSYVGGPVRDNPFAPDDGGMADSITAKEPADLDSRIEADLQELGGQMAGSILD